MKKFWMSMGMALIGLVLTVSTASAIGVGETAPAFQLESISGNETVGLEDLKGNPSLLVFWTTWCPYCRQELPHVNDMAKEYEERGVAFVGINAGWNDSRSRATAYLEENGIDDFPMVFDSGSQVSRRFALRGVPTFLVLDAEGTIRHQGFSVSEELLDTLDSLAGGE